jgi:hypothetical protein
MSLLDVTCCGLIVHTTEHAEKIEADGERCTYVLPP